MGRAALLDVYFVSAGEVTTYEVIDREAGLYVPEVGFLVELVAAPSRGAAQYAVWDKHCWDLGDLTEQRWQTKLIARGARRNRGILSQCDPFWRSGRMPEPGTLRA